MRLTHQPPELLCYHGSHRREHVPPRNPGELMPPPIPFVPMIRSSPGTTGLALQITNWNTRIRTRCTVAAKTAARSDMTITATISLKDAPRDRSLNDPGATGTFPVRASTGERALDRDDVDLLPAPTRRSTVTILYAWGRRSALRDVGLSPVPVVRAAYLRSSADDRPATLLRAVSEPRLDRATTVTLPSVSSTATPTCSKLARPC